MSDNVQRHDYDKDALHILPLSVIPLEMVGLRKARLVKNARLEGVVELFADESSGSGQIRPEDLGQAFAFDPHCTDPEVVTALSQLPSYDVYSLRIQLRELGIGINDVDSLCLSDGKVRSLAKHMRVFVKPLVQTVYGGGDHSADSLKDIVRMFADPDVDVARRNLMRLADTLQIDLMQIPRFLETYGDIYLSLAYYQHCLDEIMPTLQDLLDCMEKLQRHHNFSSHHSFQRVCASSSEKLRQISDEISGLLERFRARTVNMWCNISPEDFQIMEEMIQAYHTRIGGALCAITVKSKAWAQRFPRNNGSVPLKRAEFIMAELWPGLEGIEDLHGGRAVA